jgi:hypothetical protein
METAGQPQNEIAHHLLPLLGRSKVMMTSRQRFQGEVYSIHLTGLDEDGSVAFVRQEAEEKRIERVKWAETAELAKIARDTGGSPLALKLVVGQLDFLDLSTVLSQLQQVQVPKDVSEEDEYINFYRGIFLPSWSLLSEASQVLLISMAHFAPNVGGTPEAIAAVSDLTGAELGQCIRALWRLSFLEVGHTPTLKQIRYYLLTLTQYFVLSDIVKVI